MRTRYPQGPANRDDTSVINQRHFSRLLALLVDTRAKAALVVEGTREQHARLYTIPPTRVLGSRSDMDVMQDEIFGPVPQW